MAILIIFTRVEPEVADPWKEASRHHEGDIIEVLSDDYIFGAREPGPGLLTVHLPGIDKESLMHLRQQEYLTPHQMGGAPSPTIGPQPYPVNFGPDLTKLKFIPRRRTWTLRDTALRETQISSVKVLGAYDRIANVEPVIDVPHSVHVITIEQHEVVSWLAENVLPKKQWPNPLFKAPETA